MLAARSARALGSVRVSLLSNHWPRDTQADGTATTVTVPEPLPLRSFKARVAQPKRTSSSSTPQKQSGKQSGRQGGKQKA
jgi:hypothetical protein